MQNKDIVVKTTELKREIALGAMYSLLRGKNNNTLMGEMDFTYRKDAMLGLEKFWNVPKQKLKLSEILFGHNKEYDKMLQLLDWFANEGHRNGDQSPESIAWDVTRYVDVLRDAFYVGYINLETILLHLQNAYNISVHHFSSWKEYAEAFLSYKRYWDNENMKLVAQDLKHTTGKEYSNDEVYENYKKEGNTQIKWLEEAINTLLTDEKSIWNEVSW